MSALPQPFFSVDPLATGARVLTVDGPFRGAHGREVLDRLWLMLDGPATDIVIDLRGLTSIHPEMLSELLLALKQCEAQGRCAVIVRPNERLWGVFRLAGVERICRSANCLRDALASGTILASR